jgi:hypothetical protein
MIVIEVMPSPDRHDNTTIQQGTRAPQLPVLCRQLALT